MSLKHRVRSIEQRAGQGEDMPVPIIWDGRNEDTWRKRAEEARAGGFRLNIIRFGLAESADSKQAAEAKVAKHKERGEKTPITVTRRGAHDEVLAEWAPGLPEWLRDGDEDDVE